jgi:hypothetical protein
MNWKMKQFYIFYLFMLDKWSSLVYFTPINLLEVINSFIEYFSNNKLIHGKWKLQSRKAKRQLRVKEMLTLIWEWLIAIFCFYDRNGKKSWHSHIYLFLCCEFCLWKWSLNASINVTSYFAIFCSPSLSFKMLINAQNHQKNVNLCLVRSLKSFVALCLSSHCISSSLKHNQHIHYIEFVYVAETTATTRCYSSYTLIISMLKGN